MIDRASTKNINIYIYIYREREREIWGAYGVMITIIGNGHDEQSSNPGQDCILHSANTLGKSMNAIILPQLWLNRTGWAL